VGEFAARLLLALRKERRKKKKKRGHPWSLVPSKRLSALWFVPHKRKTEVGWGWSGGYSYSQRSSMAQTIRPIIEVNTFISGPLASLVPDNLSVENTWNFISIQASQSSYVIFYATNV